MKTFKYYVDSGHGWVAVKRTYLNDLGILNQISQGSYQKGSTVYLEEDADLSVFIKALIQKGLYRDVDWHLNVVHCKQDRSPIRSYQSFSNG